MKHIKTFENFINNIDASESLLNEETVIFNEKILKQVGKQITNANYLSKSGEVVLNTPSGDIVIGCAGGAYLSIISGNLSKVKNTSIKNASLDTYNVTIEFANGEIVELEDETGGEGIEIYMT